MPLPLDAKFDKTAGGITCSGTTFVDPDNSLQYNRNRLVRVPLFQDQMTYKPIYRTSRLFGTPNAPDFVSDNDVLANKTYYAITY